LASGATGAHLDAHAAFVADGDADHGAAVDRRRFELVRRFEMRIEAAIGVDAGIQHQAEVVSVGENAVEEFIAELAELFFALGIPEQILVFFADRNIGVHAAAVDAHHRLRQEGRGQAHIARHLAADQLVELDVVGGGHRFGVAVVDFELRGRDLRVILFVLESHRALHFGGRIDKGAQRIARQRVVIAAGVHVFELAGLVVEALGVQGP
jgi:hypothetical protein